MGSEALTLVLKVGYEGTDFSGFAFQEGQPTVAGSLIRALETVLRRPVELVCAGRTDAGVHGLGQYVSIPATVSERAAYPATRLWRSLDALTPDTVSVEQIYGAPAGFSARFDARERFYRYGIAQGMRPMLLRNRLWWVRKPLDVEAMAQGAAHLLGTHDFTSFCKSASALGRNCERTLDAIRISAVDMGDEGSLDLGAPLTEPFKGLWRTGEPTIQIDIAGTAFLHNMVRIMVGVLYEVGRGLKSPDWVAEVLARRDRTAAAQTAPAHGLTFMDVSYPEGLLVPW